MEEQNGAVGACKTDNTDESVFEDLGLMDGYPAFPKIKPKPMFTEQEFSGMNLALEAIKSNVNKLLMTLERHLKKADQNLCVDAGRLSSDIEFPYTSAEFALSHSEISKGFGLDTASTVELTQGKPTEKNVSKTDGSTSMSFDQMNAIENNSIIESTARGFSAIDSKEFIRHNKPASRPENASKVMGIFDSKEFTRLQELIDLEVRPVRFKESVVVLPDAPPHDPIFYPNDRQSTGSGPSLDINQKYVDSVFIAHKKMQTVTPQTSLFDEEEQIHEEHCIHSSGNRCSCQTMQDNYGQTSESYSFAENQKRNVSCEILEKCICEQSPERKHSFQQPEKDYFYQPAEKDNSSRPLSSEPLQQLKQENSLPETSEKYDLFRSSELFKNDNSFQELPKKNSFRESEKFDSRQFLGKSNFPEPTKQANSFQISEHKNSFRESLQKESSSQPLEKKNGFRQSLRNNNSLQPSEKDHPRYPSTKGSSSEAVGKENSSQSSEHRKSFRQPLERDKSAQTLENENCCCDCCESPKKDDSRQQSDKSGPNQ